MHKHKENNVTKKFQVFAISLIKKYKLKKMKKKKGIYRPGSGKEGATLRVVCIKQKQYKN